jgi:hypothetical protein
MKKVIANVEYDTEKADLIYKYTVGNIGDSEGYEESLYKTGEGKYFLYLNGGADSLYPEEKIKRLSPAKAEEWLKEKR